MSRSRPHLRRFAQALTRAPARGVEADAVFKKGPAERMWQDAGRMFSFGRQLIKVTFRDVASRAVISAVRMPVERLPEGFGPGSELKMAGAVYVVVSAQPDTRVKAVDIGTLEIIVRKREGSSGSPATVPPAKVGSDK
jgi:hypothetical protein